MESTFEKIYKAVMKIPKGRVATYGQIAAMAGNPVGRRL
jgi:alkylated DNA nucleotide flippase Atl1